ncbi:MAG: family NAD(P)-dependent oxidoreductase [Marmoricola sp.]|nr:family NAD(P)-dependent oxidoreductase [Marmoricola sp.]
MRRKPDVSKRDIAGLSIVITGAGRGIGEATAALLAGEGATVALGDLDTALVQAVAERIGRGAVGAHLDVSSSASWTEFLAAVGEVGPIDVLVNNAGIMPLGSVLKEPEAVAKAIIDVNVHGIINGTKAVAPGMVDRRHGHIVNVASAVGRIAVAEGATYSASKFAAVGFSEATRAELKPHGIDVSVVLPTVVQTELAAGVPTARGVKAVTAEDVAEVIATAIRTAAPELWVPRWVQGMTKATGVLPRWLQQRIAGAFGADRVLADRDETQRAAYEARVRPPAG